MPVIPTEFEVTQPSGILRFKHFLFERVGDEIEMHVHSYFHSVSCLKGRCEVYDGAGRSISLMPGQSTGIRAGREHAIRATVDATEIVNVSELGRDGT